MIDNPAVAGLGAVQRSARLESSSNKKVLIIGGGSGSASHYLSVRAGAAKVTIASHFWQKLNAAAEYIGHGVMVAQPGTTNDSEVGRFFLQARAFDHVVVNAAQTPGGLVKDLLLNQAYAAMKSALWGAYWVVSSAQICELSTLTLISGYLCVRYGE